MSIILHQEEDQSQKPYEFKRYPEYEKEIKYELLIQDGHMKAIISNDEYLNKIPKSQQVYYRKIEKEE